MVAKNKPRKKSFKQAYKEAARKAAKIPGFPSKDKILVDHLPPVRTDDWIYGALLIPGGYRKKQR